MKTTSSAPKGKEKTEKMGIGAKGGSGKMSGQNYAGPQQPGQSASMGQKTNGSVKGGRTGVMGKQHGAAPAVSGQVSSGGRGGDNTFKVVGGKAHMAPFTGSTTAKPR